MKKFFRIDLDDDFYVFKKLNNASFEIDEVYKITSGFEKSEMKYAELRKNYYGTWNLGNNLHAFMF